MNTFLFGFAIGLLAGVVIIIAVRWYDENFIHRLRCGCCGHSVGAW